jgi:hypothetical protein
MSIYDRTIPEDLDDIYTDDDGFWLPHNVDGKHIKAIVHAGRLTPRTAIVDLGTFAADCVVIVRAADYGAPLPSIDSIFFLDDVEYRVSSASRLGGLCLKISLQEVES